MEERNKEEKAGFFDGNPKMIFVFGFVTGIALVMIFGGINLSGISFASGDNDSGSESESDNTIVEGELGDAFYRATAKKIGLNMNKYDKCYEARDYANDVTDDQNAGIVDGVGGTPATFVNGEMVSGAVPPASFAGIIDEALVGDVGDFETAKAGISDGDHIFGDLNKAKVILLEYFDFECVYCTQHHSSMLAVMEDYGDDVAWVYRHFPLTQIHDNAVPVAEASECAAAQGKFWEFADAMFAR